MQRRLVIPAVLTACGLTQAYPDSRPPSAQRVALVIGNAAYPNAPLRNAVSDATDMSKLLRELGFIVLEVRDGTRAQMYATIESAGKELRASGAIGLLYFAGHAVQLDWRNYLLPVDARPMTAFDISEQSIDVQTFIEAFRLAGTSVNIIILDACRDNPFGESGRAKGLSPMDAPPGTFLAYATAPGNVASDGPQGGRNGLYTSFLLRELRNPEARIEEIFKRVRFKVRQASQGKQVPWESTSLEHEFVFATGRLAEGETRNQRESAFLRQYEEWELIRSSTRPDDLYSFLQRYPSGPFAEQAQFRLERLAASATTPAPSRTDIAELPVARDRYKVGDEILYDASDASGQRARPLTYRVTAIRGDLIEINGGTTTWDHMGNLVSDRNGTRQPAKVSIPSGLAVGKTWRTDYQVLFPGGFARAFYNMRVVSLEDVTVPAGKFKAYRVEGRGWSEGDRGLSELSDTYWIDPTTFVAVKSLWIRRVNGSVADSSARELRSLRLAART